MGTERLTVKRIKNAALPAAGKRVYLWDDVPGLCLLLTSNGPQSYYLYRKEDGRPLRYKLKGFDEVSIDGARQLARQALASGVTLQAQRKATRRAALDAETLSTLFADYLENYAKLHKREISWSEDKRMFDRYLAK